MTTQERKLQSTPRELNYKLFIGETSINIESESGMFNQVLTERYKSLPEQTKRIFLERAEVVIKNKKEK
jgi:hypothetical protein